mmetsp:Transcript_25898/g.81087  ORF Transcript_25898/g.81087 Transcript_25898/m.81087 type:complete len:275 (-) Transcript_25898:552-1376(-)
MPAVTSESGSSGRSLEAMMQMVFQVAMKTAWRLRMSPALLSCATRRPSERSSAPSTTFMPVPARTATLVRPALDTSCSIVKSASAPASGSSARCLLESRDLGLFAKSLSGRGKFACSTARPAMLSAFVQIWVKGSKALSSVMYARMSRPRPCSARMVVSFSTDSASDSVPSSLLKSGKMRSSKHVTHCASEKARPWSTRALNSVFTAQFRTSARGSRLRRCSSLSMMSQIFSSASLSPATAPAAAPCLPLTRSETRQIMPTAARLMLTSWRCDA